MKIKFCALLLFVLPSSLFVACGGSDSPAAARASEADQSTSGAATAVAPPPDSAEATVQYVVDGLLQHEPERVWASLPATYQADINRLVGGFSQKLDGDVYDRGFALVARFGELLQNKKELFLASQMLPETIDREEAAANWEAVTGMLHTLATSEIGRVETLASLDVEQFLRSTGKTLLAQAESAASAAGEDIFKDLRKLQVELVSSGPDEATIRLSGAELAEEIELVRIEERWIPRELAEEWSRSVAEALEQIEAISQEELQAMKPQILGVFGMVEGVISQIEAAETVQQLDAALQVGMFSILGMFMGSALQGPEGGMELKMR